MSYTFPPDTRAPGGPDPAADMNSVVDILTGMGFTYNVKNTAFAGGAKGDNATDDTAAIQAVLNAVPAGSVVLFPPATYLVSNLTVPAQVRLEGLGSGAVLQGKTGATGVVLAFTGPATTAIQVANIVIVPATGQTTVSINSTGVAGTQTPRLPRTGVSADYVIFLAGTVAVCQATATDTIAFAGEPGAAMQAAISALAATGGTILVKSGTYAWGSTPALPRSLPTWLKIVAEPGTIITLSSAGRRFLDFNKVADGDTFQYIHLEGFTVNCAGIAGLGGGTSAGWQHTVLGFYRNGFGQVSGSNVNLDHITVRRCRALGAFAGATTTAEQMGIYLVVNQDSAIAPACTINNILIEDFEQTGGNYAVYIAGVKVNSWSGELAITGDNIRVRDIKHDVGSDPAGFDSFAHVQIGGGAVFNTVWVENVWGRGSCDVGIELDNIQDCHVRNVHFKNCHGLAMAITNFEAPPDLNNQCYDLADITLERTAGHWDSAAASVIGVAESANQAGTALSLGRVRARNIRVYVSAASLGDIQSDQVTGELLRVTANANEVTLENAAYYATGYQQTNVSTGPAPSVIFTSPGTATTFASTKLNLRNIDIYLGIVNTGGAAKAAPNVLNLNGKLELDISNITIDCNVTSPGAGVQWAVVLANTTSTMRGIIRHIRVARNTDTGGSGFAIGGGGTLTIPDAITITDCDFSAATGNQDFNMGGNQAKVFVYRHRGVTFPPHAFTVTTPTSAAATQYAGLYEGMLLVTGGTVTAFQVSKDNSTFTNVPLAAASPWCSVLLSNADYFKVTYSVAPTLTLVPSS